MSLNKIFRNTLLVISASILLSACAVKTTGKLQGDVYTGKDTVEYYRNIWIKFFNCFKLK